MTKEDCKTKATILFQELKEKLKDNEHKSLKDLYTLFNGHNLMDDMFDFNYKNLTSTIFVNQKGECELSDNVEYWMEEFDGDLGMMQFDI